MNLFALLFALFLIAGILWDAFETVVLPRRVSRRFRIAMLALAPAWRTYSALMRRIPPGAKREGYLSYYGPLTTIWLLAVWAIGLIFGFGLLQWGLGSHISSPDRVPTLATDLYMSGTTFFTLGLGDVVPRTIGARLVTIAEAGIGVGFLALIISYLPVLYSAFSQREVRITLLDAWAGSPPTAVEFLRRLGEHDHVSALDPFLEKWEEWAADLLDSHIAYPNLCFYRSEHDNQSWLAALTTILDACAIIMAGVDGVRARTAGLTFAMARHAVVDLSQILNRPPLAPEPDRLPPEDLARLRQILAEAHLALHPGRAFEERLAELRELYEPYVNGLSGFLLMPLPAWIPGPGIRDNWQRSKWKTIAHFH
jgi:hypothetical protein